MQFQTQKSYSKHYNKSQSNDVVIKLQVLAFLFTVCVCSDKNCRQILSSMELVHPLLSSAQTATVIAWFAFSLPSPTRAQTLKIDLEPFASELLFIISVGGSHTAKRSWHII